MGRFFVGSFVHSFVRLFFVQPFVVPPSSRTQEPARQASEPDRRTDGWTDGQKISPFYRTSSPIGAAALPPPKKTKEKVEQGKGTADHLMPLGYFFILVLNFLNFLC